MEFLTTRRNDEPISFFLTKIAVLKQSLLTFMTARMLIPCDEEGDQTLNRDFNIVNNMVASYLTENYVYLAMIEDIFINYSQSLNFREDEDFEQSVRNALLKHGGSSIYPLLPMLVLLFAVMSKAQENADVFNNFRINTLFSYIDSNTTLQSSSVNLQTVVSRHAKSFSGNFYSGDKILQDHTLVFNRKLLEFADNAEQGCKEIMSQFWQHNPAASIYEQSPQKIAEEKLEAERKTTARNNQYLDMVLKLAKSMVSTAVSLANGDVTNSANFAKQGLNEAFMSAVPEAESQTYTSLPLLNDMQILKLLGASKILCSQTFQLQVNLDENQHISVSGDRVPYNLMNEYIMTLRMNLEKESSSLDKDFYTSLHERLQVLEEILIEMDSLVFRNFGKMFSLFENINNVDARLGNTIDALIKESKNLKLYFPKKRQQLLKDNAREHELLQNAQFSKHISDQQRKYADIFSNIDKVADETYWTNILTSQGGKVQAIQNSLNHFFDQLAATTGIVAHGVTQTMATPIQQTFHALVTTLSNSFLFVLTEPIFYGLILVGVVSAIITSMVNKGIAYASKTFRNIFGYKDSTGRHKILKVSTGDRVRSRVFPRASKLKKEGGGYYSKRPSSRKWRKLYKLRTRMRHRR